MKFVVDNIVIRVKKVRVLRLLFKKQYFSNGACVKTKHLTITKFISFFCKLKELNKTFFHFSGKQNVLCWDKKRRDIVSRMEFRYFQFCDFYF